MNDQIDEIRAEIERKIIARDILGVDDIFLRSLDPFKEAFPGRIDQILKNKEEGKKIIGTLCLYVPDEIIYACGADRVILCGGRSAPIEAAEEYLPRNLCPLIKSSFGSVIDQK